MSNSTRSVHTGVHTTICRHGGLSCAVPANAHLGRLHASFYTLTSCSAFSITWSVPVHPRFAQYIYARSTLVSSRWYPQVPPHTIRHFEQYPVSTRSIPVCCRFTQPHLLMPRCTLHLICGRLQARLPALRRFTQFPEGTRQLPLRATRHLTQYPVNTRQYPPDEFHKPIHSHTTPGQHLLVSTLQRAGAHLGAPQQSPLNMAQATSSTLHHPKWHAAQSRYQFVAVFSATPRRLARYPVSTRQYTQVPLHVGVFHTVYSQHPPVHRPAQCQCT